MPKPICPKCGSRRNVVPIQYGLPTHEMGTKANKGKVKLGGCLVGSGDPTHHCKKCDHDFSRHENRCPLCNRSDQVIPISYGEPTEFALNQEKQGKLKLGGCCVGDLEPSQHCKRCEEDF